MLKEVWLSYSTSTMYLWTKFDIVWGFQMEKVPGKNKKHKVLLYTLSTCGWCKKTKSLMQELDCEYEYVDIDAVHGDEGKKVREELKKYNPSQNVPTIVIDDGKTVIIGFKEDRIKEVLKDGK